VTSWIYTCPDCGGDLEPDDGGFLFCAVCEHEHPAAAFDDPDDERDRMIDDRDGIHVQR
jgi:uncharacterized Zn finger protein (UPF0148 family)